MSNTVKKLLSALLAAVLATVISFAAKAVVPVAPTVLQPILTALLVAAAHYVDAMGSTAAVVASVAKKAGPVALAVLIAIGFAHALTACSTAQLDADLHKVEVCAEDARVDACVVAVGEGAPEPATALACVQLCLSDPGAKSFALAKPVSAQ